MEEVREAVRVLLSAVARRQVQLEQKVGAQRMRL